MASCQLYRDKITGEITRVEAPNGSPSGLYNGINKLIRDKEKAADVWATAYTPQFLLRNGDWISLEKAKRIDPTNTAEIDRLSANVTSNLDENGEPTIDTLSDYIPADSITDTDSKLREKISNFLTKIGVSVQTAILPGNIQAQAELLNNVIKVSKGQVDVTVLGEEAAHFFVSMLPRDGTLYRDMMSKITSYDIYKDVLSAYRSNPSYQVGGKPNFVKLKEEAIAKIISNQLSNRDTQAPRSWLNRILDYIRSIFVVDNPFIVVADNILSAKVEGLDPENINNDNAIMYSLSSTTTADNAYNLVTTLNSQLTRAPSSTVDPETGKRLDKYFLNGKEIKRRVTDVVKDFYKKVFNTVSVDDPKREIYNIQAEHGTNIHADIEHIEHRMLNGDGTIKDNISDIGAYTPKTSKTIYDLLEKHVIERFSNIKNRYGASTRILTEVKVADTTRDIAGTIDLLVIKPNGRVDILDWKSTDFNSKKLADGLPWWKTEAYSLQLDEYANILKSQYNIDADLRRAIPIRAIYSKNATTGKYTNLHNIEVGSSTVSVDNKEYLNPVPSRTERTNIKEVDELLDKLQSLYQRIRDRKASLEERYIKNQELEKIKKAINDIQVHQNLNGLVENGKLLINNLTKALGDNSLDLSTAQTYYREILLYADLTKIMGAMEINNFSEFTEQQKKDVYELFGQANTVETTLKNWLLNAAGEIANTQGIKGIEDIEQNIGFWSGMIRSLSNTPNATVQAFYKYLTEYQNEVEIRRDENNSKLEEISNNLLAWAKHKGISKDRMFDGMLEIDNKGRWNGGFLNKYTREYLDAKKEAIEKRDINKLEELLDLSDSAKQAFDKRKQRFLDWINRTDFSLDPEKNGKIKAKKIEDWNYQYNVFDGKYKNTALLNYNNFILGKDKYVTSKWKGLMDDNSNAPLREAYNYFQSLLNYADKKLGMIDNTGKFIPSIENDKLDMWNQYGSTSIFNMNGFFESFEYKTNNTFGEIDPLTGKPKKSVPKLFLNNLGRVKKEEIGNEEYMDFSMKSKDLFTVFSLWGKHMYEYEYMSKLEEIGTLMLSVEDIKGKHLEKGADGKYKEVIGNEKNYEYLEDFINYYVYGQKLKDANAWEFDLFGKTYSGKRLVQGVIRYMGMKTLAFNTTSIAANYIGGKFNTFFVASKGKFMDRRQWAFGEYALSQDKGKALVDYFDVFLEDETYRRARQLSVYESVKKLSYDNLFIGQRLTDKAVQYPVLLGMTKSYGIIDGKIVNIKKYVQDKNGYANIYNLPIDDQKALLKKIDDEILLLEDKTIWNQAVIDDKGVIKLPNLNRHDKTVLEFRQQVRKANKSILGNATSEDISRYRMSLLGQALGQFRNWMPPLIDERFGELRYNVDSENWEKGRARVLFNNYFSTSAVNQSVSRKAMEILSKHIGTLVKDLIGFTSSGDIQDRAKALYAKEKARALEQNLPFDITEHQYIEMHIGNLKAMLNEIRLILAFTGLIFSLASVPDDDEKKAGIAKYITRMMDKFNNELLFYYIPTNSTQLIQSPIPVVSLAEDISKFFVHLAGQGYGAATDNEKLEQKYKPTKYILKDVPIMREIYTLGTIFDEDMRKAYEVTR